MLSGAGRTLTWSTYNKPVQIQKGQTTAQFDYGPDRARFRQSKTTGSETTTTVYIGKLYEQVSKAGTTERKHYIVAGGRTVAIYTDKGAGQTSTQYLHVDHHIWGGNFTAAFASGFVGGAITTGSLKGALIGGATALAFYGVGSAFPSASKLRGAAPWEKGRLWFGKIVAHGTVGGASSAAQGRSFQDGFRSAGFTQLAAPVIGSVPTDAAGRTAAAAIVGGTASKLGGGKFANGAVTGAFSRLFNDESHPDDGGRIEMRRVGDRLFPVRVFECATAECVAVGANLDLSAPGTQAFIRASNKPILDTIDNVETVFGSGAAGFGAVGQAEIALPAAGIAAGARALKVILTPPSPRQFGASVIDQAVSETITNPAGKAFVDIVGPTQRIEELTR